MSRSFPRILCALWLLLPGQVWGQAAAEGETVIARRLNDSVAVRFGADGSERVLYFFDPRVELTVGDEVEQGPSGQTTVILTGGGLLEMYSSGHLIIDGLGNLRGGELVDVLRFPMLTTVEVTSGERKVLCRLPGGTQAEFIGGRITVSVVPGRMRIRNEGGNTVEVRGLMTQEIGSTRASGRGLLTLGRGDEVAMPYFRNRNRPLGDAERSWAGLSLREVESLEVEHDGQRLVVTSSAPDSRVTAVTVGGVRSRIPSGTSLVFERQRRGAPSVLQGGGVPVAVESDPAIPAVAASEVPPEGMAAIDLQHFITARSKGHTVEELAALGYWVSPSVLAAYEQRSASVGGAQNPGKPGSGEDALPADEQGGDVVPTEPEDDDPAESAADDGLGEEDAPADEAADEAADDSEDDDNPR